MRYSRLGVAVGLVLPARSAPGGLLGFPQKFAPSFSSRTYEKRAHNSFVCGTYKNRGLRVLDLPPIGKNPPLTPQSVNQEHA